MAETIKIRKAPGTWSVRAGGAILGESTSALELIEGDAPPVIYFPRTDIATAFLEKTDKTSFCPRKGNASYYSIMTRSTVLEHAVWSYETPKEDVAAIKDHLAFYQSIDVVVEEL